VTVEEACVSFSEVRARACVGGLALALATSSALAACSSVAVDSPSLVEFEILPTLVVAADGATSVETSYVVGGGQTYRVSVNVMLSDAGAEQQAAITEVAVIYREPGSGAERSAPATQVGNTSTYVFDLPGSDKLGLCEGMTYAWSAGYDSGGGRGVASSDWHDVMPSAHYRSTGDIEQLGCADVLFLDVDGSWPIEAVPVTRIGGGPGCEFGLQFNNPGAPPDYAVLEVGGDPGQDPQRDSDPDCRRVRFTSGDYERQTVYYWTMLARQYAIDHLWVTPPGWTGPPIHTPAPVGPNVLSDITGLVGAACFLTPGDPHGCFRDFAPEGARFFVLSGEVTPALVLHEYGHYAAGYVFGYMNVVVGGAGGGFDPTSCGARGYQEAIAEMFMILVVHDARYHNEAVWTRIPHMSFELSPLDIFDNACGESDYVLGRPLVQAFYEVLWGNVWSNPADANEAMAAAFSTALAMNKGDYRVDQLGSHILNLLEQNHPDEVGAVRSIFESHGLPQYTDGS
jgi:hypothetical protein